LLFYHSLPLLDIILLFAAFSFASFVIIIIINIILDWKTQAHLFCFVLFFFRSTPRFLPSVYVHIWFFGLHKNFPFPCHAVF